MREFPSTSLEKCKIPWRCSSSEYFAGEGGEQTSSCWHFFKGRNVSWWAGAHVCFSHPGTANGHGLGWAISDACLSPFSCHLHWLFWKEQMKTLFSILPLGETSKWSFFPLPLTRIRFKTSEKILRSRWEGLVCLLAFTVMRVGHAGCVFAFPCPNRGKQLHKYLNL